MRGNGPVGSLSRVAMQLSPVRSWFLFQINLIWNLLLPLSWGGQLKKALSTSHGSIVHYDLRLDIWLQAETLIRHRRRERQWLTVPSSDDIDYVTRNFTRVELTTFNLGDTKPGSTGKLVVVLWLSCDTRHRNTQCSLQVKLGHYKAFYWTRCSNNPERCRFNSSNCFGNFDGLAIFSASVLFENQKMRPKLKNNFCYFPGFIQIQLQHLTNVWSQPKPLRLIR